ncbi:MAG: hypothetical protein ABIT37_01645 [Luteolibacter sp.]
MPETTIPDALAADLRDYFLSAQPDGVAIPAGSCRFRHEVTELPSPRLVFLAGDPKFVLRQDTTAMVPITLEYISSMDRVTPDEHRTTAGLIDGWMRAIRAAKRRNAIATRTYLHEIVIRQPVTSIRKEEREEVTTLRADITVTLCTVTEI